MKENKKRLIFMILIIVMMFSVAGTALANYSYSEGYTTSEMTNGSVEVNTYIRDWNSHNLIMAGGGGGLPVSYTSQAYLKIPGDDDYVYDRKAVNASGGTATHRVGFQSDGTRGKLRFKNTHAVGQYCIIAGEME